MKKRTPTQNLHGLIAVLAALGLLLLTASPASSQQPFEEEIGVEEILLDVVVTDRRGDVVSDLDADDFTVTVDGERREVTGAMFYDGRRSLDDNGRVVERPLPMDEPHAQRRFILMFDDPRAVSGRLTAQLLDAGRRASAWVRDDLRADDQVAVVSYGRSLELHQDFTSNHEAVAAAIDRAVTGADTTKSLRQAYDDPNAPSLFAPLPDDRGLNEDTGRIQVALEYLGRAAQRVPGRENLVLFSLGFGELDTFGFYTPDARYHDAMVQQLNEGNVSVYAVDLLPSSLSGPFRSRLLTGSLSSLATDTGGEYYYNFANFASPLEQVSDTTQGYYLLSFRSDVSDARPSYRNVDVDVEEPRTRVRVREGYLSGRSST